MKSGCSDIVSGTKEMFEFVSTFFYSYVCHARNEF